MKLFNSILLIILLSSSNLLADPASKLNAYLKKLDSYEANFQQQIVSSSRRLMDTVSGKFVLKRPNRFRWQILTPYEQIIIADGKYLWSVDIDLEQVIIADLDTSLVNSPIMILSQEDSQLDKFFKVQMMESETDMERFLLTPIDNSSNFEQVQLGFEDGILQLIELHDSLGQITIVVMTNIRNNPILADSPFIYDEFPDFDVIDSRTKGSDGD